MAVVYAALMALNYSSMAQPQPEYRFVKELFSHGLFLPHRLPVYKCDVNQGEFPQLSQLPQPPPTVVCKMEAQFGIYAHVAHTFFARFGADSHAQSALINKISASELSRKFTGSALLVGVRLRHRPPGGGVCLPALPLRQAGGRGLRYPAALGRRRRRPGLGRRTPEEEAVDCGHGVPHADLSRYLPIHCIYPTNTHSAHRTRTWCCDILLDMFRTVSETVSEHLVTCYVLVTVLATCWTVGPHTCRT